MTPHRFVPALRSFLVASAIVGVATSLSPAQAAEDDLQLAEPFRSEYSGEDATGEHVIALWQFNQPDPAADLSGNGHELTLRGAEFVDGGRFGGALRSYRGWPVEDTAHQARAKNSPSLTPAGAFTIEMWIQPADELREYPDAFLVDKKYVADDDYQLVLMRETAPDMRHLRMSLGFGKESATWQSDLLHVPPGQWRHIAFTYDGAGTGAFFIDGSPAGSDYQTGYGRISPGRHDLVLGDRFGSYYHGFPGLIDQVRITRGVLRFTPVTFELLSPRRVFERMEQAEPLRFGLTNLTSRPLTGARALFSLGGAGRQAMELPEIASGQQHVLEYRFDTALRPNTYELSASVELPGDEPFSASQSFELVLVPRQPAHSMPVVMWGGASGRREELREIGFTHAIGVGCDFSAVWEAEGPTQPGDDARIAAGIQELDAALAAGMRIVSSLSPGSWARSQADYQRIRRNGEPYTGREDVCAQFERIQQFCGDVGESMARAYGRHPAFDSALIHTEVRGHSNPCFHEHDRKAFEQFAGFPIPDEVVNMRGVRYDKLDDFPENRVIPDDHPIYVYYKWLWKNGDGWNELHTRLHRGLKAGAHARFWTFHDPAVRVASVWGSGGEVDYLSQWTYSYPDPIRIGLATEELFQMASAGDRPQLPAQRVMKMTQIIWYRNQTAPEPGEKAKEQTADFDDQDMRPQGTGMVDAAGQYRAWWEVEEPGARFITIAP
ncbi:MAG: LamG domain-containing protein, partial [Thermoguttaceae bacterium]|nr:LamG domain-containing protein [Thermoguttaceae bacterium]